jgi:pyruvate dehydrogenase (quinone)
MAKTVSDQLIERLVEWGVHRVYGYPGDGINGVMGALRRAADKLEFVQTPHEELAAFMAAAHPKFTGEVGVCIATSGPGAIHLLNGLYDAKADHQPVLAIVGQQARSALGGDYQQEVDLVSLFKDVAHEYVQMATVPEQILHLVDRVMRIARDRRAVTCLILPNDLQELAAVEPSREHAMMHTGIGYTSSPQSARDLDVAAAAAVLNAGKKVAILAGAGALGATDELVAVADRLGAGIAKALLGKMAVPDDLPNVTGAIGLLGTAPSWKMMEDCDTLLMVGSSFPYSEFLPKPGQARAVQIDIEPRQLGLRYPMEVNLVGDAKLTLQALLPMLKTREDSAWRDTIESDVRDWWRVLEARAMTDATPINPQRVFWELSARLPDDVILTADSGTVASWYARDLKARRGMMGTLSGGLATMGPAVPYALTAKMAWPDRPVIALLGDGAMQMLGINGLIAIAREWRHWKDPRLVVMVLNNGDLNLVTWEQRSSEGDPKFEGSQDLPSFPYAQYSRLLGLGGIRVDKPGDVAAAWDEALRADRPTVLEMVTDPTVPAAPPHITAKQLRHYASALLHGDPQALQVVKSSAREWWDGLAAARQ